MSSMILPPMHWASACRISAADWRGRSGARYAYRRAGTGNGPWSRRACSRPIRVDRAGWRRWQCHAARAGFARGGDHRHFAPPIRPRVRGDRVVGTRPGQSLRRVVRACRKARNARDARTHHQSLSRLRSAMPRGGRDILRHARHLRRRCGADLRRAGRRLHHGRHRAQDLRNLPALPFPRAF